MYPQDKENINHFIELGVAALNVEVKSLLSRNFKGWGSETPHMVFFGNTEEIGCASFQRTASISLRCQQGHFIIMLMYNLLLSLFNFVHAMYEHTYSVNRFPVARR